MAYHCRALSFLAFVYVFLQLAVALPAPVTTSNLAMDSHKNSNTERGCTDLTPVLPVNGGPTELPTPPKNLTLKYVTVGRGVQNYSCATSKSTPVPVGAIATLYDATSVAFRSTKTLHSIPPAALTVPLTSALIMGNPLTVPSIGSYPIIGSHYFEADGTPTFDLITVREILFAKKIADVKAPANASKGSDGHGAVDWLTLGDKGESVGLSQVYRVVTVGGSPPSTCMEGDVNAIISVQYAAEYWIYGYPRTV